jgi:predicted RNase H-like HicB family nuclease
MIRYQAAYRLQMGTFFAEVPDFLDVSAIGQSLAQTRNQLVTALRIAAEGKLRRGELLPLPNPNRTQPEAYLVETLTVLPVSADQVTIQVG